MLCPNCASQLFDENGLCQNCRHAVTHTVVPLESVDDSLFPLQAPSSSSITQPAPLQVEAQHPPYARFAVLSTLISLCLSVVVFCSFNDLARSHLYFAPLIFISTVTALLLSWPIRATCDALRQMDSLADQMAAKRKKLRSVALFFCACFMFIGGLVGYFIGQSGAETEKLLADYGEFSKVGDHISELRSSAEVTVPAQLAMYEKLVIPLRKFRQTAVQVKSDLVPYDSKYPGSHESTQKWMNAMEFAIKRADILQKQIEIAKSIEQLDPEEQDIAWRTRMQPALDEETALEQAN